MTWIEQTLRMTFQEGFTQLIIKVDPRDGQRGHSNTHTKVVPRPAVNNMLGSIHLDGLDQAQI